MLARIASFVIGLFLLLAGWLHAQDSPSYQSALHIDSVCGAMVQGGGPPPEPFGNQCDLQLSCAACFFTGGSCVACGSTKSYLLCGTPAEQTCSDMSYVLNCGQAKVYQDASSAEECGTCIGTGRVDQMCMKNSCSGSLVDKKNN